MDELNQQRGPNKRRKPIKVRPNVPRGNRARSTGITLQAGPGARATGSGGSTATTTPRARRVPNLPAPRPGSPTTVPRPSRGAPNTPIPRPRRGAENSTRPATNVPLLGDPGYKAPKAMTPRQGGRGPNLPLPPGLAKKAAGVQSARSFTRGAANKRKNA